MSKLQTLVVIASILVLLAENSHHVQSRPGPPTFYAAKTENFSRQLLSAESVDSVPQNVKLLNGDAEEQTSEEEELDDDCRENDCDQRRLLTDSIDYKNDGPNNPITDPPH